MDSRDVHRIADPFGGSVLSGDPMESVLSLQTFAGTGGSADEACTSGCVTDGCSGCTTGCRTTGCTGPTSGCNTTGCGGFVTSGVECGPTIDCGV